MLSIRRHLNTDELRSIFVFGILLRIIVFAFQGPFNNDKHFEIVRYIYVHHALPASSQLTEAFQPPLYYVLASLFFPGGAKGTQLFSLLLSMASLCVIYRLIRKLEFIRKDQKKYCLLLVCLLPQLIMFGNYISNDALAIFIGSLVFFQLYKYISSPTMLSQNILALYLGLGLLTKGTFLSYIPPLILSVLMVNFRNKSGLKKMIFSVFVFIFIFSIVGSYKYVENEIRFRNPVFSCLDNSSGRRPIWAETQKFAHRGIGSVADINVFKLCKYPTESQHTCYSFPLMLYGTFWYQYIPESNFYGNMLEYKYLGSFIYIFALVPTLLFIIGFFRISASARAALGHKTMDSAFEFASLLILLLNLAMLILVGFKYDIYSIFQSRLLFPSFFSVIILFNSGLDFVRSRYAFIRGFLHEALKGLFILFVIYFIIEITGRVIVI